MKNAITWFEIPVSDFDRALKFYNHIIEGELEIHDFGGFKMGWFPYDEKSVSGSICYGEDYVPSKNGVVIYFDANPDLNRMLDKVKEAGGEIIQGKTLITEDIGYMALFIDSEGNRIALHSKN